MYTLPPTECPFCYAKVNFTVTAVDSYKRVKEVTIQGNHIHIVEVDTLAKCPNCNNSCLIKIEIPEKHYSEMREALQNFQYQPSRPLYFKILKVYPEPKPVYSHPSLPDKVRVVFEDLQEMLREKKEPSLIVGGCRAVLESAIKYLGGEGDRLIDKIDDLLRKGIITKPIADWAHHVRIEGNESLHDLLYTDITPEEAEEIVEFVKLFLIYTFELPARIKEKRRS
ncbi:DUF4145 domain-containing protein [Thermodesulfobacterium commune]|uniref:DUF4145 domain-containing protein n=1 Tax=Thermodesulfobacterium commune DSM 2178 TaxID=289377 RepID=A0A075WVF5_9BACT|nr:DUF4145 domain-containing protein [Thermodesulfobacterium commune]AIH04453.1 hypothetical protein HL41_06925 [Thermodesulfobacterium commune DSM 2178]